MTSDAFPAPARGSGGAPATAGSIDDVRPEQVLDRRGERVHEPFVAAGRAKESVVARPATIAATSTRYSARQRRRVLDRRYLLIE